MKKNLIIILCVLFVVQICNAQQQGPTIYLYTPNGSLVEACQYGDMNPDEIAAARSEYAEVYPQATILADPTWIFNCHSYAWNIIETEGVAYEVNQLGNQNGGEDFIEALYSLGVTFCWIEGLYGVLDKYWTDLSYIETTTVEAEKVFYYNGFHSAVVSTTHPGKYESKWGAGPLMRHAPDYGPELYDMEHRRYYKKYCGELTAFVNKTINQNTTVNGCIINIQNVTVQNNSKLTVNSATEVTINGPFEVKSGTQFEVNIKKRL